MTVRLRVARVAGAEDLPLPAYASAGSAGLDLRAAVDGERVVTPGERLRILTGLRVAVPAGYEAQVRPRSGLALHHGIVLPNAPGTIDSDYRGEVQVILWNAGPEPFTIARGDRVAQLVISPIVQVVVEESQLDETSRAGGGFGSTGRS